MTPEDAVFLTGKLLARYPSARVDKVVLATWAEELTERFGEKDAEEVAQFIKAYCRANPRTYAPSVDELCSWMRDAMERNKPEALPEPPMSKERFREGIASVYRALENGSGPIAKDWKMRQAGDT